MISWKLFKQTNIVQTIECQDFGKLKKNVALLEQSKVHKSNLRTSSDGEAPPTQRGFCLWHHSILGSEKRDIKVELNGKSK